eukprot:NODE_4424_length_1893_cov_8.066251.p1 GENE.NODE_4424_length_1893_cov_8.066251~~NODE_4424_length_1893_cov_8.066251.p1  ORF type:complete len:502 (+),score=99.42 NODE_4424_length_1893_cov_8.066251:114-1619(+)
MLTEDEPQATDALPAASMSPRRLRRSSLLSCDFAGEEPQTVMGVIDSIGFGYYQISILTMCMLLSASISILQFVPLLEQEMFKGPLATNQSPGLTASIFSFGFIGGILVGGPLGDTSGRKLPRFIGTIGVISTTLLSLLCTTALPLFTLFALLGMFIGICTSQVIITIYETSPRKWRATLTFLAGVGDPLGGLIWIMSLVICRVIAVDGQLNWRAILSVNLVIPVATLVWMLVSEPLRYHTPHYLAMQCRDSELHAVLAAMNRLNNGEHLKSYVLSEDMRFTLVEGDDEQSMQLFATIATTMTSPDAPQLLFLSIALCGNFFVAGVLTQAIPLLHMELGEINYVVLVIGVVLTGLIIFVGCPALFQWCSTRTTLVFYASSLGCILLCFAFVTDTTTTILLINFTASAILPLRSVLFVIINELLPTAGRSTMFALINVTALIALAIAPIICGAAPYTCLVAAGVWLVLVAMTTPFVLRDTTSDLEVVAYLDGEDVLIGSARS